MKPWEIWTWKFPDAGDRPAVVPGTDECVKLKPRINVLLCSSQRAVREAEPHEIVLDEADGLSRSTFCKCDFVYGVLKSELTGRRGLVVTERRRGIAERLIRGLGLAGL